MTEQEWVDQYLTGRTSSWDELIRSGRVPLEELEDGILKKQLKIFLYEEIVCETLLEKFDYEAD